MPKYLPKLTIKSNKNALKYIKHIFLTNFWS